MDDIKEKLSRTDKYKLVKSAIFTDQGNAIISNDEAQPPSFTSTIPAEKSDAYYKNRIEASYCFRNANGLMYFVFDKNIRTFWKWFKGDKSALKGIMAAEKSAYDSLLAADNLRENAEYEMYVENKIPMVIKAERIETQALLLLGKVLYVYLNLPETPDLSWLLSADKNKPGKLMASANNEVNPDTVNHEMTSQIPRHLAEEQMETFKEFSTMPLAGIKSIDYNNLYNTVIDSVHKKWHEEFTFKNIFADAPPLFNPVIQTSHRQIIRKDTTARPEITFSTDTIYMVQIVACRVQPDQHRLKQIYSGNEKITLFVEDNWFKYRAGPYKTYTEALLFKDKITATKAFIVVFCKGKKIKEYF